MTPEPSLRQGWASLKAEKKTSTQPRPPAASPIFRLAIVEDDPAIRQSLVGIFALTQDLRVVAVCADAQAALREVPPRVPDLVLMDIDLPGMSGIDCLLLLRAVLPKVRVMMFTAYGDDDSLFRSLQAGADGFLLKPVTPRKLLESVREILAGGSSLSPPMARRMIDYFQKAKLTAPEKEPRAAPLGTLVELTPREVEVLEKLAQGLSVKEVSTALTITWQTVRTHIASIYDKLHVHSRTEAVLKYLGRGPR